jgi:hypothetical protein
MKKRPKPVRPMAIATVAAVMLILTGGTGLPQTAQPAGGAPSGVPYVLTMGDMMNTLIQPRHAKLGLAGHAQSWALAAYALAEIQQSFVGISKAQPKFGGMPVPELIDAALTQAYKAVDAAIKQQDPQKFAAAYDQLSQGCNACHIELNHPFVVIKTPDASVFPNQDFSPKQ